MEPIKFIRKCLIVFIKSYQLGISPFIGQHCRFHPTCSHYATTAIESHGIIRGTWLSIKRVLRCHPWNEGGYDPVPSNKVLNHDGL